MKYKKGDVLKFKDSVFFVESLGKAGYNIMIFEEFKFDSRSCNESLKRGAVTFFNKNFVEKHCTLYKGASAGAMKVLFGS